MRRWNCAIASSMARSARSTKMAPPDFASLQAALSEGTTENLVHFAFDVLFDGGEDLRSMRLIERKERLRNLLAEAGDAPRIRYVEHFESGGDAVLRSACKLHLEGVISKQMDAPYQSGRADSWAKSKTPGRP